MANPSSRDRSDSFPEVNVVEGNEVTAGRVRRAPDGAGTPDGIGDGAGAANDGHGAAIRVAPRKSLRTFTLPLVAVLAVLVIAAGVIYWRSHLGLVKTDNAQTMADLAPISARIPGTVVKVDVVENQQVRAGDVLVELDPTDYRLALGHAQAQLTAAQAQVRAAGAALTAQEQAFTATVSAAGAGLQASEPRLPQSEAQLLMDEKTTAAQVAQAQAQLTTATAAVRAAKTTLDVASHTMDRDRMLYTQGAIAAQQVDSDTAAYEAARASYQAAQDALRAAQANLASAEAARQQVVIARHAVEVSQGEISQARAQVQQAAAGQAVVRQRGQELAAEAQAADAAGAVKVAEVNLDRTLVRAPADGWVVSATPVGFSVEPGQVVQPDVPLMYLTLSGRSWVVANIKEKQVGAGRVGDPVRITVDALRGQVFHGRVESIGSATGSATALLPPDNATGNFIKVVQLVPVRIALDADLEPGPRLQVGLSAEVTIDTRQRER